MYRNHSRNLERRCHKKPFLEDQSAAVSRITIKCPPPCLLPVHSQGRLHHNQKGTINDQAIKRSNISQSKCCTTVSITISTINHPRSINATMSSRMKATFPVGTEVIYEKKYFGEVTSARRCKGTDFFKYDVKLTQQLVATG